ncbi:cysteine dioxygenase [Duganella sp. S19_KUP01_CR8]|uniref:cysteine dioxygenase family protein n=1 Tax=Duganella sp. S19_KUP01_CR8 TaxID=3025502 RepID=UPI002FCDC37D
MQQAKPQPDLPPRLRRFVEGMDALLARGPAEAGVVAHGGALLRALLAHDDWLPDALAQPHPQFYRQYLLYLDPASRYSVASFVWGPGQRTPLHDHTVWGLVGILRGAEVAQPWRYDDSGALVADGAPLLLRAGEVSAVSPTLGDIHEVRNAYEDRVSVGVHVYGADIGAVDRFVYAPDGSRKPFRSGYANR